MQRRKFIQYSVLLIGSTLFADKIKLYSSHVKILKEPFQTIAKVHDDLFTPSAGMPKPQDFNAIGFLEGVMRDPRVRDTQKEFIKDGVSWLNIVTNKIYRHNYIELDSNQREIILQHIASKEWGNDWLWYIINHAFEAMLSDPVYGANTNEIGWKWLNFIPGEPRPPRVNPYV